ncbi:MAG: Flp family type IVb pilin [Dermatophilaceae bacterium]
MYFFESRSVGRRRFFARGDRGATAVEYGLLVGFIAVVIVVAVTQWR